MDEYPVPTYATSNYLEWLHPGLNAEKQVRQLEIHRKMSQMMVESYWKQIHDRREAWWLEQRPETD